VSNCFYDFFLFHGEILTFFGFTFPPNQNIIFVSIFNNLTKNICI